MFIKTKNTREVTEQTETIITVSGDEQRKLNRYFELLTLSVSLYIQILTMGQDIENILLKKKLEGMNTLFCTFLGL